MMTVIRVDLEDVLKSHAQFVGHDEPFAALVRDSAA